MKQEIKSPTIEMSGRTLLIFMILMVLLFACGVGIGWLTGNAHGREKAQHNSKATGWYYLQIPDSPHVANPTLELDYTADDTAHLNWYWKDSVVAGYQVYLLDDSISVMDGNRLVKKLGYNTDFGKIMTKDNE
jgi:hypothetical protein